MSPETDPLSDRPVDRSRWPYLAWGILSLVWLGLVVLSFMSLTSIFQAAGIGMVVSALFVLTLALVPPALGAVGLALLTRPAPRAAMQPPSAPDNLDIEKLVKRQQDLDRRLSRMEASRVQPTRPRPQKEPQDDIPQLPLEPTTAAPAAPALSMGDLLMALNFPKDVDDEDGFAALERARRDGRWSVVLSAAEDVLNLLSQDGIYLDDLGGQRLPVALWRAYAAGDRDGVAQALDPQHNADAVAQITARSREDGVFRDALLHLLRRFETLLSDVSETLSDEDLDAAMETRTARAFVLLNRAVGALSSRG